MSFTLLGESSVGVAFRYDDGETAKDFAVCDATIKKLSNQTARSAYLSSLNTYNLAVKNEEDPLPEEPVEVVEEWTTEDINHKTTYFGGVDLEDEAAFSAACTNYLNSEKGYSI